MNRTRIRWIAIVCAAVLVLTAGATALAFSDDATTLAVTEDSGTPYNSVPAVDATLPFGRGECPVLTDEQKAALEARRAQFDAMQDKWSGLTDAQREEIYAMKDKAVDIDAQIIDKYLEWGLIDEATAAEMKQRLADCKTQMRERGCMPMPGGMRGGKGRRGRGGCRFDGTVPDGTTQQQTFVQQSRNSTTGYGSL